MKVRLRTILMVACFTMYITANAQKTKHQFSIEILADEALQLIDPDAEIEVVGSGFEWTEGPLWIDDGNYLLFSDIPQNKVL